MIGALPRTKLPPALAAAADRRRLAARYQAFHHRRQRTVVGYPPVGPLSDHRTAHLRHLRAHRRRLGDRRVARRPRALSGGLGCRRQAAAGDRVDIDDHAAALLDDAAALG